MRWYVRVCVCMCERKPFSKMATLLTSLSYVYFLARRLKFKMRTTAIRRKKPASQNTHESKLHCTAHSEHNAPPAAPANSYSHRALAAVRCCVARVRRHAKIDTRISRQFRLIFADTSRRGITVKVNRTAATSTPPIGLPPPHPAHPAHQRREHAQTRIKQEWQTQKRTE